MKKTLLFFIILLTIIISPTANAEISKLETEEITSINEEIEGKIYKYGTPINVGTNDYIIYYFDTLDSRIAGAYQDNNNENIFIGYNSENINLKDISLYWKIDHIEYNYDYKVLYTIAFRNDYGTCNLLNLHIGDICYNKAKIYSYDYTVVEYYDKNGTRLGNSGVYPYTSTNYSPEYIGRIQWDGSVEDVTNAWRLKETFSWSSGMYYVFEESEPEDTTIKMNLTCDKNTINYKDKTTCHVDVSNYKITTDPIILSLKEKDDINIINIYPSELFDVENNDNTITITPKYVSSTREDIELFSFEVKAKKEKNEIDNLEIKDITYYNGETYTNLKTTINIENKSFLSSNPLTANPTLFKILLVSVLLLISSSLLIKKQRT